ncbi:hypothetical protein ACGC1H_006047 [Rhizoctonia solani]
MYFGARPVPENLDYPSTWLDVCDYIDDYRSSTILDVIGSVGGLFAVLHGVYVLLFGRPLFWGLSGHQAHHSVRAIWKVYLQRFLRTSDGAVPSQIRRKQRRLDRHAVVRFLRDFVIDFGPADFNPEGHTYQESTSSPSLVAKNEGSSDVDSARTPLMHIDTGSTPAKG